MVRQGPSHRVDLLPATPSHAQQDKPGFPASQPLQPSRHFPCRGPPPDPQTPAHLQCMMEEWCSPYSSCPSTMNGCSGRAPPPSAPAAEARVSVSSASTRSSGQGSASGPLASAFFSALWDKQSGDKSAVSGPHIWGPAAGQLGCQATACWGRLSVGTGSRRKSSGCREQHPACPRTGRLLLCQWPLSGDLPPLIGPAEGVVGHGHPRPVTADTTQDRPTIKISEHLVSARHCVTTFDSRI